MTMTMTMTMRNDNDNDNVPSQGVAKHLLGHPLGTFRVCSYSSQVKHHVGVAIGIAVREVDGVL